MHNLNFSMVDLLVVLTLIVSTALAIWRGFVRETLSIFAWAAAAFATLYFGPAAAGLVHTRFATSYLAPVLTYIAVFLIVLIPLSFVSYRFSEGVKNSPIGAVDRSLGAAFGVIRGLAVVGLCYLLFSIVVPVPNQPLWVKQAHFLPVIQASGDVLLSLVPSRAAAHFETASEVAMPEPSVVPKPRPTIAARRATKAYGAEDRHALDKLIQSTGSGGTNQP
ncbi:MAG: CvpA family protein [Rhizomicrobium sp.]|jgi:membrane protein required for colicin V production